MLLVQVDIKQGWKYTGAPGDFASEMQKKNSPQK